MAKRRKAVRMTLAVTSGRRGKIGKGATFTGRWLETGRIVTAIANYFVFPEDARIPQAGDVWFVTGRFVPNTKVPDAPPLLKVYSCTPKAPEGDYLVHFLTHNEGLSGIGVGAGKIGGIVDFFKKTWPDSLPEGDAEQTWWKQLVSRLDAGDAHFFEDNGLLTERSARRLVDAWRDLDRGEIKIAAYLQEKGFDSRLANKVIRLWGDDVIETLRENPYYMLCLVSDWKKGWKTIDTIARTGYRIAATDPRRRIGAVQACLYERLVDGSHTLTFHETLLKGVMERLACLPDEAEAAIQLALRCEAVVGSRESGFQTPGAAWLEAHVREHLLALHSESGLTRGEWRRTRLDKDYIDQMIADYERRERRKPGMEQFALNTEQRQAVHMILGHPVSVLCGGAGVGKTTTLAVVLHILKDQQQAFHQMAIAGRAAKRMNQTTGEHAHTVAGFINKLQLLELELGFYPLLIIDESSMLDLPIMDQLLRALKSAPVRFLFVGDPHQLPPISYGLVFHRLAESDMIPRVELTEVKRSMAETGIPAVTLAIRNRTVPEIPAYHGKADGVSFYDCAEKDIEKVLPGILEDLGDVDGDEVQLLAIRNEGHGGVGPINAAIQKWLDKRVLDSTETRRPELEIDGLLDRFCVGDAVMFTENDFNRDIYNGSLGLILDVQDDVLVCDFEGVEFRLRGEDIGKLVLAHAVTVHKGQGSQFQRVVVPIVHSPWLLDRAMVYTAATRGIRQVVFVGNRSAFEAAIPRRTKVEERQVGLMF